MDPSPYPSTASVKRRGGDNFDLDSARAARSRRDRAALVVVVEVERPQPRPRRPLTRREQFRLTAAFAATVAVVAALLVAGAAFIDFTGPASPQDALAAAPFVPVAVASAAEREGPIFLTQEAVPASGEGTMPVLPDPPPPAFGQPVHAVNNPAPLPPDLTATPFVSPPTTPAAEQQSNGRAVVPVGGWISSYFAADHAGIDIAAASGLPVVATAGGVVRTVNDWRVSYGRHVIVDHGGDWDSLYAHLTNAVVQPGQHVAAGQVLGWVGATGKATGPHLHFELRYRGSAVDPLIFLPH